MPILTNLRAARERALLSQDELAALSGVTQAAISHAERGRPTRGLTARRLAKALRVTPAELVGAPASPREAPTPATAPAVLHGTERRARALAELRDDCRRALERGDLAAAARYEAALAAYGESPLR